MLSELDISHFALSASVRTALTTPIAVKTQKSAWYASTSLQPGLNCKAWMIRPEASLPIDDPSVDVVTYHASTSDLVDGVVSCDITDLFVRYVSVDVL